MVNSITYEDAKTLRPGNQAYFDRNLHERLREWHSKTGSQTGWYTIQRVEVRSDNVLLDIGDRHNWSYRWFSNTRR